jgi:hypothetical protein
MHRKKTKMSPTQEVDITGFDNINMEV